MMKVVKNASHLSRIRKIIQAPKKSRHGILALGVVTVGTVLASISPSYADDTLYATNSSYISPPSFSLEDNVVWDLKVGSWNDVWSMLWRFSYLSYLFTPSLLTYPFAWLFPSYFDGFWWANLRQAITLSGPCCIKLSQWISTRPDLFSLKICHELRDLQSFTAVTSVMDAENILAKSFGEDWKKWIKLSKIDDRLDVYGSGCVAQVLKGFRSTGESVAIKMIRPGVRQAIELDLKILIVLADLLDESMPGYNYFHDAVKEFSALMTDQIDLRREAENLATFRRNFGCADKDTWKQSLLNRTSIDFPRPDQRWVSRDVLIENFIEGKLMLDHLNDNVHDRKALASLGLNAMLKMIFEDNFVHADLHPGNIIVQEKPSYFGDRLTTKDFRLSLIDAGIAVKLTSEDRRDFVELFQAIIDNDGRRAGRYMIERSRSCCSDPQGFEDKLHDIINRVHEKGLKLSMIDLGVLLKNVLILSHEYDVKLRASFVSVFIAIGVVEGLGRRLDPSMDILQQAAPYVLKAMLTLPKN